ncbi:hypothetical protein DIURU_000570 [Diutina rugosa]|uniref:Processing of GAS1 and ALP protein 2 n=1 Tax=Diutina rugosa TaxID=5481 RepID=A0A642UXK1_DIURU|nr:uncharacterized protein DIURU_000570 [Diutina rugosa]KAA8907250.1 hypothetical protein DIURU_000570 [Diutina rugosa]
MFEFVYNYVEPEKFKQYFRLFLFIVVYIMFRGYYSNWAKQRQVKAQLEQDKREAEEKPERERQEREAQLQKIEEEAQSFGWGKQTRSKAKRNEAILQEAVAELRERNQSAYDAAEDHDIEELLED